MITYTREDLLQVAELTAQRVVKAMCKELKLIPDYYTREQIIAQIGRSRYDRWKGKRFDVVKKGGKSAGVFVDREQFDKLMQKTEL
jgi:hypothetical protein